MSLSDALVEAQSGADGQPITISLSAGAHSLGASPVVFDNQTGSSEIWIIGPNGTSVTASTIRVSGGAPPVHLWGLSLVVGSVDVDGGVLDLVNTSLATEASRRRRLADSRSDGEALVRVHGGAQVQMESVTIEGATPNGAVAVISGSLTMIECQLRGNSARWGGALRVDGGTVRVERSTFEENHAERSGGALYVRGGVVRLLDTTLFAKNTARNGASIDLLPSGLITYDLVMNEMSRGDCCCPCKQTLLLRLTHIAA